MTACLLSGRSGLLQWGLGNCAEWLALRMTATHVAQRCRELRMEMIGRYAARYCQHVLPMLRQYSVVVVKSLVKNSK